MKCSGPLSKAAESWHLGCYDELVTELCRASCFSGRSSREMVQALEAAESPLATERDFNDDIIAQVTALVARPTVEDVLKTADTCSFDAFSLDEVTEQQPLLTLGYWVLQTSGTIKNQGILPIGMCNLGSIWQPILEKECWLQSYLLG